MTEPAQHLCFTMMRSRQPMLVTAGVVVSVFAAVSGGANVSPPRTEQPQGGDGPAVVSPTGATGRHEAPEPEAHWRALLARPISAARDAELAVTLQALINQSPPVAAERLRALPDALRRTVVTTLFTDRSQQPAQARRLADDLGVSDAAWFSDHGHSLAYVLNAAGEYEALIRFAVQQNANGGESELPIEWLQAAFRAWTATQPEAAAAYVLALPARLREEALQAVAASWARSAPLDALAFIERMPLENERRTGIASALRSWGETGPAAAAAWIQRRPPNGDLDLVVARLLAHDHYVEQPDAGLALAANIVDAELRSHAVARLLERVAQKDPAGARQRALATPALLPDDKAALLAGAHPAK